MILITREAIDVQFVLGKVESELSGATVLFLGTTRKITAGRETSRLEYECYESMATKEIDKLVKTAKARWSIELVAVAHRIGLVEVGETSVAVAVSAPHRGEAFEAAKWLIDTLKEVVPIWKKENYADGTREWVHPDLKGKPVN